MIRFIIIVCYLLLPVGVSDCAAIGNPNLIQEFFTQRNLKTVILFHCSSNIQEIRSTIQLLVDNFNGTFQILSIRDGIGGLNLIHIMRSYPNDLGVSVDLNCHHVESLLDAMSLNNFFNASCEWLMFGGPPSLEEVSDLLRSQNLNMDSRVTVALDLRDETRPAYELFEVYNVYYHKNGKFHVSPAGRWDSEAGFQMTWISSEYERRFNFEGLKLRVIFTDMKFRHNETILGRLESNQTIKSYSIFRFGHRYIQMLKEKHNFRAQYIQAPTWGFESIAKNNSAGVIGQLKEKLADIAEDPFYIFKERIYLLDFTAIIGKHTTMIVFRHPKRIANSEAFLEPFNWDIWYALLATTVITCIALFIVFQQEGRLFQRLMISSREYILTNFAFLCQQGCNGDQIIYASKLSIYVAVLFFWLMFQFYGNFILGTLLTPPPKNLKTPRQLVDSNLQVGIESVFYNKEFVASFYNRSTDPAVRELFTKKIFKSPSGMNASVGLALVKKGGFAFQCDTGYAYPIVKNSFTDDEICDLQDIQIVPPGPLYLPLQKGSPLKQFFRVTFWKLLESGAGRYYDRVYFSQKPECPQSDLDTVQIGMGQVKCLFYFLFGTMLVCLFLLTLERIQFRRKKWKGDIGCLF